ncbi:hypothetical protein [Micromonospora sp. RP3T]|uniref:hypothetical protein n=1 Tax=Micromonospora sp. RP3T TaxID=2135446 RepID=UPI003D72FA62
MSVVANIAKGAVAAYAAQAQASVGAILAIPLLASGLPTEDTLADYTTVADLLAGAADENTTMGRKTLTGVTVSTNNTTNSRAVDSGDPSWTSGQMGGGAVAKLCYAYDPNPGSGTDAELVPLVYLDCAVTPDGNAFTYANAAAGWYSAT